MVREGGGGVGGGGGGGGGCRRGEEDETGETECDTSTKKLRCVHLDKTAAIGEMSSSLFTFNRGKECPD